LPTYKVISGSVTRHGRDGKKRYAPGDTFEAPEHEVQYKMDLLEEVKKPDLKTNPAPPKEPEPEPEPEHESGESGLYVKHQGFGKYGIYDQDADDWFDKLGVTKEEAEAKLAEIQ